MRTRLAALAAVALAATPLAAAPDPGSAETRNYLAAAVQSDTFELMEAHTVLTESRDPRVRDFAQRMIQDHTQTSRELADAARAAGLMPPPMHLGSDQAAMLAALQSARGHDFDTLYARQQALAHHAALVTEQRYAASGDTPALKQVASAAIPVITGHLAMAEQMQAALGGS